MLQTLPTWIYLLLAVYNIQGGKTRENHWLTLKPGSIGSNVLVAAQYNRTHWQEWSWDIPQCDWAVCSECGKIDSKEDLSPMKIAIWLTDTTALKNTSQKKAPCKTRQQSQPAQQRSFCYLLSRTNTALIFLRQLRAIEHFTFVFSEALQNFRLQVYTDRISISLPAGKTSTEWCVKRSFQPLTTTWLAIHILILCWSHVVLIEKLVGVAITKRVKWPIVSFSWKIQGPQQKEETWSFSAGVEGCFTLI